MERPLRLIAGNPLDQLARTIEALLVVASAPLSAAELAEAADDDPERVEAALGLVGERYREGRSGIVLERVFGLESLSQLPRLDDIGEDTEQIRERLHAVAEQRSA